MSMRLYNMRRSRLLTITGILLSLGAACLLAPRPLAAQEAWRKMQAFGVEVELPARWTRFEYRVPKDDHDEIQFAENARDPSAGAWFSVFPNATDLVDLSREEKSIDLAGRPAILTNFVSPPGEGPRRRQIIVYFEDKRLPAFLFDGEAGKWTTLGPILTRIHASIRLMPKAR